MTALAASDCGQKQLHVCLSRAVTCAVVRVPEPFALMFSFQDRVDGRKRSEHLVIALWYLFVFLYHTRYSQ